MRIICIELTLIPELWGAKIPGPTKIQAFFQGFSEWSAAIAFSGCYSLMAAPIFTEKSPNEQDGLGAQRAR
ncbi:MAG: hypothetical protein KAR65_10660 [Anaerolineales bacterium]|nr:hypothetical protein [Anaerolineales bacterium]